MTTTIPHKTQPKDRLSDGPPMSVQQQPWPFTRCLNTGMTLAWMSQLVGLVFASGLSVAMMGADPAAFSALSFPERALFFLATAVTSLGFFVQWFYIIPLLFIGLSAWPFTRQKNFGGFVLGVFACALTTLVISIIVSLSAVWFGQLN